MENTSHGEEAIIGPLLSYGRAAYILRVCLYVSHLVSVGLACGSSCTGHRAGSRLAPPGL